MNKLFFLCRKKIALFAIFCTLVYGCSDIPFEKNPAFEVINKSSGVIKFIDIKIISSDKKATDILIFNNLAANSKSYEAVNISYLNIQGDGSYQVFATLEDGKTLQKTFDYITNGSDMAKKAYLIEIHESEIILK